MKTNRFLIPLMLIGLVSLFSCNQTEETGSVTIGLELNEEELLKAASNQNHLSFALVTILGKDGSLIYDKERLELVKFGDGIVTRSLKLPVGGCVLTEFMLTDTAGTGNGRVRLKIETNVSLAPRTGTVLIEDVEVIVSQAAGRRAR